VIPPMAVAGIRGGVGTTTIARALNATDLGTRPPSRHQLPYTLVVVLSPAADDTARLAEALTHLHRLGLELNKRCALAVVSDGHGPVPAVSRARLRMARGQVAYVARVPYVARWRATGVDRHTAPPGWRNALKLIRLELEPATVLPHRQVIERPRRAFSISVSTEVR
jgi:hypothetical protein